MLIQVDVFAWIPNPDVPNPIHSLPGGVATWGSGACGPRFGGDDFVTPPVSLTGWATKTFRAKQQVKFLADPWGVVSSPTLGRVAPGLTTVLTAPRSAGGAVCHSLTPIVLGESVDVTFDAGAGWYEVRMRGKVMDPVPVATGASTGTRVGTAVGEAIDGAFRKVGIRPTALAPVMGRGGGAVGGTSAQIVTPALEWDLTLRLQSGASVANLTRARYAADAPLSLDNSPRLGTGHRLGSTASNIAHGIITTRRFPSYIVYLSVTPLGGAIATQPVFFADASSRNFLEIVASQDSQIRQIVW